MSPWRLIRKPGEEWEGRVDACPNADVYHRYSYLDAMNFDDFASPILLVYESTQGLVVHPMLLRSLTSLSPKYSGLSDATTCYGYGGPAWAPRGGDGSRELLEEFWEGEAHFLRELGVVAEFIRFNPLSPAHGFGERFGNLVARGETVVIDLSKKEGDILGACSENHLRNIRKAKREGLTVAFTDQPASLSPFYELYRQTMDRLKATSEYYFPLQRLKCLFDLPRGSAWVATCFRGKEVLASNLLLSNQETFHYHLGASNENARDIGANHFLMMKSFLFAKSMGAKRFHLGGGYSSKPYGLFRFKNGFGGDLNMFFTGERVIREESYERICRDINVPGVQSTFFPVYRDPQLVPSHEKRAAKGTANVVIISAGGHAQVVADILMRARGAGQDVEPLGYLDDDPGLAGKTLLGLPVLGKVSDLSRIEHDAVVVSIGDNDRRSKVYDRLMEQGERRFAVALHPSANIAPGVKIGPGTMVCAKVVVNTQSEVGEDVILNTGCTVDHHSVIGAHVHIAPGVHLGSEVTVEEGAMVGIGAVVLPQVRIGAWSMVGAGAVVLKDVPPGVTVVGAPAKPLEKKA